MNGVDDAVILSAVRTPVGRFQGTLASVPAAQLGATAVRAALEQIEGLDPAEIDEVLMGDVVSAGLGQNIARQCAISSDPEDRLVGWTVSRIGADHVLWASDFPHPDAEFPDAVDEFIEAASAGGLGPTDLAAIFWRTAASFYQVENRFAAAGVHAPRQE